MSLPHLDEKSERLLIELLFTQLRCLGYETSWRQKGNLVFEDLYKQTLCRFKNVEKRAGELEIKSRFKRPDVICLHNTEFYRMVYTVNYYIDELKYVDECLEQLPKEEQPFFDPLRQHLIKERNRCNFVDKSMLIKDIVSFNHVPFIITRPRRFGKSMNLRMIEAYFSEKVLGMETKELFKHLAINTKEHSEEPGHRFQDLYQGQYAVVMFNFKGVFDHEYEGLKRGFKSAISKTFKDHRDLLLKSGRLSHEQVQKLDLYCHSHQSWNDDMFEGAIPTIVDYLNQVTGKKVVILVDEYDLPAWGAWEGGCFEKLFKILDMFYTPLKENEKIFKAVLTGVACYKLGNTPASSFNSEYYYGLDNPKLSTCVGFTDDEVKVLLENHGLLNKLNDLRGYYNGFICGNKENRANMYSPVSIQKYLQCPIDGIRPYWTETGIIDAKIFSSAEKNKDIEEAIYQLATRGKFETTRPQDRVEIPIDFGSFSLERLRDVLTFLYMTGYLTRCDETTFVFPNKDVEEEFKYRSPIPPKKGWGGCFINIMWEE